mmetsp:Transcript_35124/g.77292  ORF Transcript_35124/g.77292 Transcript_35124/m.77292 type:complete len:423 (-) Transcript_35124:883-2151(-)
MMKICTQPTSPMRYKYMRTHKDIRCTSALPRDHWYDTSQTLLVRMAVRGVSPAQHAKLWPHLLRVQSYEIRHPPGYFSALQELARTELGKPTAARNFHVTRIRDSMPQMISAREELWRLEMQRAWLLVLCMYALHHPEAGYTPSFGHIAASLLSVVSDPELAFWTFVSIMEDEQLLALRSFGAHLPCIMQFGGVIQEVHVLAKLVCEQLPRLAHHLSVTLAEHFESVSQALIFLGADRWLGSLFTWWESDAAALHNAGPGSSFVGLLSRKFFDACCICGMSAAHLIALEFVVMARSRLMQQHAPAAMLTSMRSVERSVASSPESIAMLLHRAMISSRLKSMSARRQRMLRDMYGHRDANELPQPFTREMLWSVRLHPLFPPKHRAVVRTLLMMQRRPGNLFSHLPVELLRVHLLTKLAYRDC